jgi:hypothetical protein
MIDDSLEPDHENSIHKTCQVFKTWQVLNWTFTVKNQLNLIFSHNPTWATCRSPLQGLYHLGDELQFGISLKFSVLFVDEMIFPV